MAWIPNFECTFHLSMNVTCAPVDLQDDSFVALSLVEFSYSTWCNLRTKQVVEHDQNM